MAKYYARDYKEITTIEEIASESIYGSGGGSGSCFIAGTLIRTALGYKPIEKIVPSDLVLSYDKFGNIEHGYVSQIFKHTSEDIIDGLYDFTVTNGYITLEYPTVTGNHAIYDINSNEHKEAKEFSIGESFVDISGREFVITAIKVTSVEDIPEDCFTYNFEVTPQHTYFVGDGKYWFKVHNGGGGQAKQTAPRPPVEAPNSLHSTAIAKVLEILSEGPVDGVVGGEQGVYFNQTPVQNTDSSYNFPNITIQGRLGTPDQTVIEGFSEVESTYGPGSSILITRNNPHTENIIGTNVNAAVITISLPTGLSNQDTSTGDLNGYSVGLKIETRVLPSGSWSTALDTIIQGKAISAVERDYRVTAPGSSWAFRVSRTSNDDLTANVHSVIHYSRHTEIIEQAYNYPDTALVGLIVPAESVGNTIPARGYDLKGLIIKVPSNYDPILRTYAGLWDGTFKYAWTDNTAWVLYDLLTNPRYGVDTYLNQTIEVNKWAFYDAAVYNDELVMDGNGGMEPRYTFNGVIQTQEDAWQLLHAVASNMRANIAMAGSEITIIQDRPTAVVKVINNSNVIDGLFTYSSVNSTTRTTSCNVTFSDKNDHYLPRTITVENTTVAGTQNVDYGNGIEIFGYNVVDLLAYGIVTESAARRMARHELYSNAKQYELVVFAMALNVVDITVGDVVSIMDDDYANDTTFLAGRITSLVGNTVVLDNPITLTASGFILEFNSADYDGVLEYPIVQGAGTYTTLTLTSSPIAGDYANHEFIAYKAGTIVPREFRITSITESSRGIYTLSGLMYEASKYDAIESGIFVDPANYSNLDEAATPTGLTVTETYRSDGVITHNIVTLSWDYDPKAYSYDLYIRKDMGDYYPHLAFKQNYDEWTDLLPGNYDFVLVAMNLLKRKSAPALLSYTYRLNTTSSLLPPKNFYVTGTTDTVFEGPDLPTIWEYDPLNDTKPDKLRDYILEVYSADGLTQYNSYSTDYNRTAPNLKGGKGYYPKGIIYTDFGFSSLPRSFQLWAYSRDTMGKTSVPNIQTFSNPAPPMLSGGYLSGSGKQVVFNFTNYTAPSDAFELIIAASRTSGFQPSESQYWVYRGPILNGIMGVTVLAPDYGTYYVRSAINDNYDTGTLNWTNEISVILAPEATPMAFAVPSMPGNFTAVLRTRQAASGEILNSVDLAWTAPAEAVTGYTVGGLHATDETEWHYFDTAATSVNIGNLVAGKTYRVTVRSNYGDAHSAFVPPLNVSVTGDTTATSPPSGVIISQGIDIITLKWNLPPETDYKATEIWASITNNLATATNTALSYGNSFSFPALAPGSVFYFWLRCVDTSYNLSSFYPASPTAGLVGTTSQVDSNHLTAAINTALANGTAAAEGTANYRTPGSASNNPVPQTINMIDGGSGTRDITISWATYVQGSVPADYLVVYAKNGSTALATTDPSIHVPLTATTYTFKGVDYNGYRVGISTARNTDNGVILGTIIQPASAPNWIIPSGTANIVSNIAGVPAATVNANIATAGTTATWAGVAGTGKPADFATVNTGIFANLTGQVTANNYATYVGNNAFSSLGFSQNKVTSGTSLTTSLVLNSNGENVVAIISGRLSTATGGAGGISTLNFSFTVNGVSYYNDQAARLANLGTTDYQMVTVSQPILVASPGAGGVTYSLTITVSQTGTGTGSLCGWPTIQLMALKR